MIRDWSNFIAERTAVVTGGGGGVGRAIAIQMARAGAHIWVNDLFAERAEEVCREIEAEHGQVWDTQELRRDFEVVGFLAPLVVVRRRADGAKGSLEFQADPRFYFNFVPHSR